ncbi:MAG TPA: hypothetical protein VFE12_12525 [Acetobacteraceae bacterium]|jgi:hypothetical protein|nr:hypothetical protein [Acetobacteraceae bacterium]
MKLPKSPLNPPKGLAFEIGDLIMALGWAEFHRLRMVVELDHCTAGEEYEEVLAFYPANSGFRRWSIWRSCDDVVVQPSKGHLAHFMSLAGAFDAIIPAAGEPAGFDAI